jgi:prepilin-type N-terminal cleavage/methylation domain-containing protein
MIIEVLNTKSKKSLGFTLLELVVVMGVLSILIALSITLIDPVKQISRARDSQKRSDLEQIKTALDLYYEDNKCYPTPNSLEFGSKWESENGKVVYMAKVPVSPDSNTPYNYLTDGLCPQWYLLDVRGSVDHGLISASNKTSCALDSQNGCMPFSEENYTHICTYGGIVDCGYISSTPLSN